MIHSTEYRATARPSRSFARITNAVLAFCFSGPVALCQVPPISAPQPTRPTQNDYFHTGAGALYLRRAEGDVIVETVRGNISVLFGSGGNIVALSGKQGKILVDSGIGVSETKIKAALNKISPAPLAYVIDTHWHWDHTDGNGWMHKSGATIIAHRNTLKHLSQATHVDDWHWTMPPVSVGARPTVLVDENKTLSFAGDIIHIEHYGPGHTDGDLSVYFEKADVLALGDTFWNGYYPFIDNQDGGNINDAIKWANKTVELTTDKTIVIPGHGPVGTRTQLIEFRDMLVTVRGKIAELKRQGKSLDEIIAAKPTAPFDEKWGHFVIDPAHFTRLVYAGL